MNPSTGTFISMDSYQGSIYDPVTLHKYLYANANPVMYTDPSGYLVKQLIATAGQLILDVAQLWYDSVMFRIGMSLVTTLICAKASSMVESNHIYVIDAALRSGNIFNCIDCIVKDVKDEVIEETENRENKKRIYTVYTLVDPGKNVRYVGGTKNYKKRIAEHRKPGGKIHDYTLEEGAYFSELTWNEARGLEQTLMYCYHTLNGTNETALLGVNFINGVSPNNKNRENYYNDTIKYIDKYPTYFENQLDNEINNIKEDINYWWK